MRNLSFFNTSPPRFELDVSALEHYINSLQKTPEWVELMCKFVDTRHKLRQLHNLQHVPLGPLVKSSRASRFPITSELNLNLYPSAQYLQRLVKISERILSTCYSVGPQKLPIGPASYLMSALESLSFLVCKVYDYADEVKQNDLSSEFKRLVHEEMVEFYQNRGFREFNCLHYLDCIPRQNAFKILPHSYSNILKKPNTFLVRDIFPFRVPNLPAERSRKFKEEAAVFCCEMYLPVFVATFKLLRYLLERECAVYKASVFCLYYRHLDGRGLHDLVLARKYTDLLIYSTLYHPRCANVMRVAEEVTGPVQVVRAPLNRRDIEVYLCIHLLLYREDSPAKFQQLFHQHLRPFHRGGLDRDPDDTETLRATLARVLRRVPVTTLSVLCRTFHSQKPLML